MQHMTKLKRRLSVVVGVSVVTQPKPRSTALYLTAGLHAEVNEHNHPVNFDLQSGALVNSWDSC